MTKSSGLYEARGQIAWILALIISTAIVVRLEQLELGSQLSVLASNPLAETELAGDITLQQARLRAPDPATASPTDQIHLLTALILAGTQGTADMAVLAAEAADTIAAIEGGDPADPALRDAISLSRSFFGL